MRLGHWAWVGLGWAMLLTGPADAMGAGTKPPITASCVAASEKVTLPEGLCDTFATRLEQAMPGRTVLTDPAPGAERIVLVVLTASPRRFEARLDVNDTKGDPLGTARFDADLDGAALAALIDQLIAKAGLGG